MSGLRGVIKFLKIVLLISLLAYSILRMIYYGGQVQWWRGQTMAILNAYSKNIPKEGLELSPNIDLDASTTEEMASQVLETIEEWLEGQQKWGFCIIHLHNSNDMIIPVLHMYLYYVLFIMRD